MAPHANGDSNGFAIVAQPPVANDRELFVVQSPNVFYTEDSIKSTYTYRTTKVSKGAGDKYVAQPCETKYDFRVERKVGKTGLMLVGWGGNNGSTVTAGIIANRRGLTWESREGKRSANYYGSVIMGSTLKLGNDSETGEEIHIPFHDVLPMIHPNDLVLGGWDINSMNLADAMDRAAVLDPDLKNKVRDEMREMTPLPSIYYPDFIAANQGSRANNLLSGTKEDHLGKIRRDIR
jgi:myo-inositol-1-phosphate synthase